MKTLILICLLFFCFAVRSDASQTPQEYYDILVDSAGNTAEELLQDIGIESGSFDELINIDFRNVLNQLLEICRSEMKEPFVTAFSVFVLLMILSIVRTLISNCSDLAEIISYAGTVMAAFMILVPLSTLIADVVSVTSYTHDYMKILIPVYAGIITVLGKPTLAFCLQGSVFATAQMLATFMRTSLPVISVIYTTMSVSSCLSNDIKTDRIAQLSKKIYIGILTFCSVLFSGFLSVKSVLASSADTITVRGIKFLIGNSVPVVGGALSESLNTVISGISLLKSTTGIISVFLLVAMNLPTLIELMLWIFSLKILAAVASLVGQDVEEQLFESVSGLFSILTAVVIYQAFLYIVCISMVAVVAGMRL